MKKVIKLSESQLKDIIGNILSEQINYPTAADDPRISDGRMFMGGQMGPGKFDIRQYETPITMDSSLFENGVDKIDTGSQTFLRAISAIRRVLLNDPSIVFNVVGGASAVGSKTGYKNDALALRRAQNFVQAAVAEGIPATSFTMGKPVVGTAEVKNSPEARVEQFVKLYYKKRGESTTQRASIDNTELVRNMNISSKKAEGKKIGTKNYYKVCYWIPEEYWPEVIQLVSSRGGIPVKYQ
jgi:hypothetical protein